MNILPALTFTLLAAISLDAATTVWDVAGDSGGAQDGASRATAYTAVQPAIAAAIGFQVNGGPPEVWAAESAYVEAWIIVPNFPRVSANSVVNMIDEGEG